jgi:hypothetical protein
MKINDGTVQNAEYDLISVLWKGTECMVKVRTLSEIELKAVGNFSMLQLRKSPVADDDRRWAEYASIYNKIVRAALVNPTFTEVFKVAKCDGLADDAEKTFAELEKEIATMSPGPERKMYEQQSASLRALFDLVLPEDFMIMVADYATGRNNSDIDKVTEEIVWQAACLQKMQGGRVSDYCHGMFTDFMRSEIDAAGLCIYAERMNRKG